MEILAKPRRPLASSGRKDTVISVIIPVYNRFQYLDQALISAFAQTPGPGEVIIVDDCSTESLQKHLDRFPPPGQVRVLRTDRNRRVAGARNWGWRHAKGDLIAFLDSDDIWEPHKTKVQLDFLEANPGLDGVYGSMIAFWPDGRTQLWASNRPSTIETKYALIDCNITVQTLLIRRTALELLNGFDERFGILDDQDMTIRIAESGLRIGFFAEPPVTRRRCHDTNYSDRSTMYFREEYRIVSENRSRCNLIYGSGSERVHLARALTRLSLTSRLLRLPALALARYLFATAPNSKMPRTLWTVPSETSGDSGCNLRQPVRHGFSPAGKLRTAFRTLGEKGPAAVLSLLQRNLRAAVRILPAGLVRVGTCSFRPSDEATRCRLLSGQYEAPERLGTRRYIRRDIPVIEFGASLGVVSCLVNRRLKIPQNHVVVEANPALLPILIENRDRNRCKFEIVHGAAGAQGSTVRLYIGSDALNSSLLTPTGSSVEVPAVTLGEILEAHAFDCCGLICDIEGAELSLIRAELATFQSKVEIFIVEFHPAIYGWEALDAACRLLMEHGFDTVWRQDNTVAFKNTALAQGSSSERHLDRPGIALMS